MAEESPILHILALGPPEVRVDDNLVSFPTRKTLALLIYLAIEGGLQLREHLAALFLPEANSERSYANLRNTLGHLQTVFRRFSNQAYPPYLTVTNQALGLNQDTPIDFDVHTVEHAYTLARADRSSRKLTERSASLPWLQSAAGCQRGDFLAGFSLADAPGFDDWAASQREIWRRRLSLVLDRLSEIQFSSGDFTGATDTASRWITLDRLNGMPCLPLRHSIKAGSTSDLICFLLPIKLSSTKNILLLQPKAYRLSSSEII